jgi:hypothetical protein
MIWWKSRERSAGKLRRSAAILAAGLVLFAQLLAAAHRHNTFSFDSHAQSEVGSDAGLCAACLLAFHLPLNPATAPAVLRPQFAVRGTPAPVSHAFRPFNFCSFLTRAPPLAA